MNSLSTAEAAEKWGTSTRQVQRLLTADRIPDAQKHGHVWVIPADADKPRDPHQETKTAQDALLADLEYLVAANWRHPAPHDDPESLAGTTADERVRLLSKAATAYLRGDFELIKNLYQTTKGDDALRLVTSSVAFAAAMSMGDYPFFLEIENFVKDIGKAANHEKVVVFTDFLLSGAYVSAFAPGMVSGWVKEGDFSALPRELMLTAAEMRVSYLWSLGKMESVLHAAQIALGFCDVRQGIWFYDIYLYCFCSIACCTLGRMAEAKRWLLDAMRIALPHGFTTPFAELAADWNGLLEQVLKQEYPEQYDAVIGQWKRTVPNWLDFHNHFTRDNLTRILTLRELEMVRLAARGSSNAEIARQFHISEGRVKNVLSGIYDRLLIRGRKDLEGFLGP